LSGYSEIDCENGRKILEAGGILLQLPVMVWLRVAMLDLEAGY